MLSYGYAECSITSAFTLRRGIARILFIPVYKHATSTVDKYRFRLYNLIAAKKEKGRLLAVTREFPATARGFNAPFMTRLKLLQSEIIGMFMGVYVSTVNYFEIRKPFREAVIKSVVCKHNSSLNQIPHSKKMSFIILIDIPAY